MDHGGESEDFSSPPPELEAFRGLIGQFIGLWPSPKAVEDRVKCNWIPLVKEGIKSYFVGKGFFVFVFENVKDRSLIFRNGPYFMGPQGLYLNKWSPDFDPAQDVPTAVPVWVCLPHLPLHCWSQNSLQSIINALGRYIDQAPRKDQYSCARICIEADLEIGPPEAIKLSVANWTHIQELDYEQLHFKCRYCHEYGHFARYCKKKNEETIEREKGEQWKQVKKSANNRQNNKRKAKETGDKSGQEIESHQNVRNKEVMSTVEDKNPFESLTPPSEPLETEQEDPPQLKNIDSQAPGNTSNPNPSNKSSPSYADIIKQKKKKIDNAGSSDDETFERPSKRVGRRSNKEAREEESERQKTLGSQTTIEMTLGRNIKPRASKGGGPTPTSCK
eukprot:PITA_13884